MVWQPLVLSPDSMRGTMKIETLLDNSAWALSAELNLFKRTPSNQLRT